MKAFPGRSIFHKPQVNVVHFDVSNKGSCCVYRIDYGYKYCHSDLPELENISCKEAISVVLASPCLNIVSLLHLELKMSNPLLNIFSLDT